MLRRISIIFVLLFSIVANAADNVIAMSYATMSIYQNIVLSSTQKAGGTFTLTVQAKDGGGRGPPNFPSDVANLTLKYYNSSGTLLATSTSNNSTTYGESTFRTYTLTSANCGGSCANVYYVQVSFTGNDGGYWAGNMGTNFVSPELTFTPTGSTASTNILYNPEFGVYGTATSTSGPQGWWNTTNAWGGNTHPQLINYGAAVNPDAGGYFVQGGTLSGQVGGYPAVVITDITTVGTSSGITSAQATSKSTNTTLRQAQTGNQIYVDQVGNTNTITLRQGTGKNRMDVYSHGDGNTLNLNQGYAADGTVNIGDANEHYLNLHLSGNSNNVTTVQKDSGQYNETTISGNSNIVNLTQTGSGSKTLFANINGGSNNVTAQQKDSGQDYLGIKLTGNGHTVNATQQGAGNHQANIDLTNSGGSSTLNMTQQGSTAQSYSITQSCVNPAGCSTTIVQGQ